METILHQLQHHKINQMIRGKVNQMIPILMPDVLKTQVR